jgi:hypothetical protein
MENTQDLSQSPSYVRYAFEDQHNVVLMFGAACFSLAFATPIPLVAGAGCELAWLVIGPRLPAFRRWIDRRLDAQRRAQADEALEAMLGKLPATHSRRFQLANRAADEVLMLARNRRGMPPAELRSAELGLDRVRTAFLDYQLLSVRVATLIGSTPIAAIEKEAARLQEAYAADKDLSVRMTIRKALTQNQRQQQQLQQLTSVDRTIELRLSMIEKALAYLKGQVADAASNLLSHELDGLLAEVGAASRLEVAINDAFSGAGPSWAPSM